MRLGFATAALVSLAVIAALVWWISSDETEVSQQPLKLYCAAAVYPAALEIAKQYEQEYGVRIDIVPGASGALLAEIKANPSDGHLYLPADETFIEQGRRFTPPGWKQPLLAEAIPVARWHPVLALAPGNPAGIEKLEDLLHDDVKLALANLQAASVGRTVEQALKPSGLWAKIEAKGKSGSSVTYVGTEPDVANQLKTGAAHAGFVWHVTASQKQLETLEFAELQAARQTVYVSVLNGHDRAADALRFARYLTSKDKGQPAFVRQNYEPIENADEWSDLEPEITIYAGTMLKPALDEAIERFERREGVKINPVYQGCGTLVALMDGQVRESHELLPEAFASCDTKFMQMVAEHFEPGVDLARNPLVIVVAKGNPKGIRTLADLQQPGLRLGLADPMKTALGDLTERLLSSVPALDEEGQPLVVDGRPLTLRQRVYELNEPRTWASGHELIVQARTALDAAIAYKSNVMSAAENLQELDMVEISLPEANATQPFAISKQSSHKQLLRRLLETIVAEPSQRRFEEIGFDWLYASQAETGTGDQPAPRAGG